MRNYNYTARSEQGGQVSGIVEAASREDAIRQLRDQQLIVEQVSEIGGSREIDLDIRSRRVREKDLSIVCEQFSILLRAGLPIIRTLELVAEQTEDKRLKQTLIGAATDVSAGYSLADSFERQPSKLPATFIESVRAGEESGSLDSAFLRLKSYFEKTDRTKSKVRSALVYPVFVMVVAVVVVAIIMIFAVPVFRSTFESMGTELPAITQFVIDASDFMTSWWWLIVLVVAAAVVAVKVLQRKNEKFRLALSRLGSRLPVFGKISLMTAASQYAGTMSVMMASGLPIVRAVSVTARSMTSYYFAQSLENTTSDLEAGKSLATCLAAEGTLPELAIEMTAVGEQTGSFETTMQVVSDYYDNEVETVTTRAMSILEPSIIVVLALIVFVLLLSVYLPMFSMYGSM